MFLVVVVVVVVVLFTAAVRLVVSTVVGLVETFVVAVAVLGLGDEIETGD